ncbi:MAG: RidA family protein [Rhodobacteraceae bacterium]|nr:RidA family protein [Paracoccaceae bacterium]
MLKHKTPDTIRRPFANYSHGVEVPPNARLVFTSGQLAVTLDDEIPQTTRAQADLCFDNIEHILHASGMEMADVVRINAYVTGREHMAEYMAARDARFGDTPPASTLMIVTGFTREEFTVEVEAIAAKCD